ncbi:glutathione S-transferase N-terminal domain-containing protein [Thalassotalea psychrophila]|uniref:Glutathione S-transferase N-terminal domain-containing protein n=1 Tax=Thalassotalea psychrophila TaxID=3065647 RepID=A0ABY9TYH3_9GAMM|nr:glutathione S-transferase N-terminal domain-containing protein [Colwelliaceae bacterium SQ149]
MKLYENTQAPNARRVRMFLAEKGIELESIQVDIIKGENLQADFLSKNPRGLLPVLELEDGTCIDETMAICRYFEDIQPENPLFGHDAKSKALIESKNRQIEFDGLLPLADILRNSAPNFANRAIAGRENVQAISELIPRGKSSFLEFLNRLEQLLTQNEYIAGEYFSVADITAFCVIDFASWVKIEIPATHCNTITWYNKVVTRASALA